MFTEGIASAVMAYSAPSFQANDPARVLIAAGSDDLSQPFACVAHCQRIAVFANL
jgi:hypothetical protein